MAIDRAGAAGRVAGSRVATASRTGGVVLDAPQGFLELAAAITGGGRVIRAVIGQTFLQPVEEAAQIVVIDAEAALELLINLAPFELLAQFFEHEVSGAAFVFKVPDILRDRV